MPPQSSQLWNLGSYSGSSVLLHCQHSGKVPLMAACCVAWSAGRGPGPAAAVAHWGKLAKSEPGEPGLLPCREMHHTCLCMCIRTAGYALCWASKRMLFCFIPCLFSFCIEGRFNCTLQRALPQRR